MFSPDEIDKLFVSITEQVHGPRSCLCPSTTHAEIHPANQPCPHPAVVTVRLHMVANCKIAHQMRPDLIDPEGFGTQVMCQKCSNEMRDYVSRAIMATIEYIAQRSALLGQPPPRPVCECGLDITEVDNIVRIAEVIA
jgi:hypothetical protein